MQRSASYATAMGLPSVASFGGGGGDGRGMMSAFASRMQMSHSGPDMLTGQPGSPAPQGGTAASVAGMVAGGRLRRSRAASATDSPAAGGRGVGGSGSSLPNAGGGGGWGAVVGLPSHTSDESPAAQGEGAQRHRLTPGQRRASANQLSSVDDLGSDDDANDGGAPGPGAAAVAAGNASESMTPANTDATSDDAGDGCVTFSSPTSVMVRAAGLLDAVVADVTSAVVAQWWTDHSDDVVAAFEASVGVDKKDAAVGDETHLQARAVGHVLACLLLRLLDGCASAPRPAPRSPASGSHAPPKHRKASGHSLELHSAVGLLSEALAEFAFGAFGLPGMTRTPSTKEASLVLHHILRIAGPEVRVVQRPHAPTPAEALGVGGGNLGAS
jgi:hypothetical protein